MSLDYAHEVALRSTCPTRIAGAVLEAVNGAVATGYEGAARGQGHCDVVGCTLAASACLRTVPAELNAIIEAARRGIGTVGATLYVKGPAQSQQWVIAAIINAGVSALVLSNELAPELHAQLENAGIEIHNGGQPRPIRP